MRICSFVPGATELIAALGLADSLVGRSHECDYPDEIRAVPVLASSVMDTAAAASADIDRAVRAELESGRPFSVVDASRLAAAAPDLIITQELCHVCGVTPAHVRSALAGSPAAPRLLSLSPSSLEDILSGLERLGEATGTPARAALIIEELRARCDRVRQRAALGTGRPRVACLEWLDPFYAAGHWVPEMVALAGGKDVLTRPGAPSRRVTWDEVVASQPDVLLLMPCGFSLAKTLAEFPRYVTSWPWEALPAIQKGRAYALDANAYFSRPGPRLFRGLEILSELFAAEVSSAALPDGVRPVSPLPAEPLTDS